MWWRRKESTQASQSESLLSGEFLRKLETLSLLSKRASQGGGRGERRGKKRGSGVEFCDHRPYVPGDDIKYLDWMSLYRHDRLVLRLYEEEEDQRTDIVLDASASMAITPEKWLLSRKLAAALGFVALTSFDRLSVHLLYEDGLMTFGPARGRGRLLSLLRFLEGARARGKTKLGSLGSHLTKTSSRPDTLIVVSDFFESSFAGEAVEALHYRGLRPTLLQLHGTDPIDASYRGEFLAEDVETGEQRRIALDTRGAAQVRERVELRTRELRLAALRRGLLHLSLDESRSFDDLTLTVLRRGGLLG